MSVRIHQHEHKGSHIAVELEASTAYIYVDNRLYIKCSYRFLQETLELIKAKIEYKHELNEGVRK